MRHVWVRNSRGGKRSAQQYFADTFWRSHRNYQFTVAKAYYGLYELGVTCEQYDALKSELENRIGGHSLPGINCTELMRDGDDADVRQKSFKNHGEYGAYQISFVQANNRRLVSEKRSEVAAHFEKAKRRLEESGEKLIVAFDLEVYEYDKDKVLEIGYVAVKLGTAGAAPEMAEKCHLIIEENLELKNKDFVADNRDGFRFGSSETIAQEAGVERFRQAVEKCTFLVAHASRNDEAYLKKVGLDLSELKKEIMDTQQIEQHKEFAASRYESDRLYLRNLGRLLQNYAVSHEEKDLHNAGCDAYYTMKAFLRQMGHEASVVNSLA